LRAGATPRRVVVAGRELVLWRGPDGAPHAAPDACPHMGASLSGGRVDAEGRVVCPWHGLALGERGFRDWACVPVHDDGVLLHVQLGGEPALPAPPLPPRPARPVDAVIRKIARCEPEDVIANRLDPWHGAHFHPYSFAALEVLDTTDDVLTLRVAYRVAGPLQMTVDATFHCPGPRTIVMTIIDGDGAGSVVETHATPLEPGRTAVVEATLATSDRAGFAVARALAPLLRPAIRAAASRLWVDDVAYAERRYALRTQRVGGQ
ncbi:MAG: Rieske (2Fe-2S) protein, partial [Myxococcales bacterium]|nr:Rieske (2Fe-2S) protein [Myxococcales bacterium]